MRTDVSRKVSPGRVGFYLYQHHLGSCRLGCAFGQLRVGTVSRSETERAKHTTNTTAAVEWHNTPTPPSSGDSNPADCRVERWASARRRRGNNATERTGFVLGNIYISVAVTPPGQKSCLLIYSNETARTGELARYFVGFVVIGFFAALLAPSALGRSKGMTSIVCSYRQCCPFGMMHWKRLVKAVFKALPVR